MKNSYTPDSAAMFSYFYVFRVLYVINNLLSFARSDHFENDKTTLPPYRLPPGFLPRVVNMEMSWYGISQDHPLPVSSKNAKASKLMTENTLGRPHIIFQSGMPPIPPKFPRQVLAERGAKFLLAENEGNKILFKFIQEGGFGDGFTVRRVVSEKSDTRLVINKGQFYTCEKGFPLTEGHAKFTNFNCSEGGTIIKLDPNLDLCTEGENAVLEFCENHGWMFCMGPIGTKNEPLCFICDGRVSVNLQNFYDKCAIDQNIVLWYSYYGDIPAKYTASQLCPRLYPCTLSYLYRLEAPWGPNPTPPTSTMDPCLTSVCPECSSTTMSSKTSSTTMSSGNGSNGTG